MSWQRMIHRNQLTGGYRDFWPVHPRLALIAGDLRRIESDQRDARHLARFAAVAGITPEQARAVLDVLFDADCEGQQYGAPQ